MKRLGLIASLLLMGSVFANASMTADEALMYAKNFIKEKTAYNFDSISIAQSKEMMTHLDIALGDSMIVEEPSWIFFIDPSPKMSWGHTCKYIAISPEKKEIRVATKEMYPENSEEWTFVHEPVMYTKDFSYTTRFVKPGLFKSKRTSTVKSNAYALLISGGSNITGNWQDGWNEMSVVYQALTDLHGYKKENIVSIMSDGDNPGADMYVQGVGNVSSPRDLDGDGKNDINYASTNANVKLAFNELAQKATKDDDVFIYMVSHGNVDLISLYGKNQYLFAKELAVYLNQITAKTITVYVSACHSGSFVDDISGPNRTIVTSTAADESGWVNESGVNAYDFSTSDFGTFWRPYLGALTGIDYKTDAHIECDANEDGKNDMLESYVYGIENDVHTQIDIIGEKYHGDPIHSTPYLWTSNALSQSVNITAGSGRVMSGNEIVANSKISNAHLVYQSPKSITFTSGFSYKKSGKAQLIAIVNDDILKDIPKEKTIIPDDVYNDKEMGNYTYSNCIDSDNNISIYPNPTEGIINISVSNDSIDNIIVTDITGNELINLAVNANHVEINLSAYNKGLYLVKVVTENDSYTKKVVLK